MRRPRRRTGRTAWRERRSGQSASRPATGGRREQHDQQRGLADQRDGKREGDRNAPGPRPSGKWRRPAPAPEAPRRRPRSRAAICRAKRDEREHRDEGQRQRELEPGQQRFFSSSSSVLVRPVRTEDRPSPRNRPRASSGRRRTQAPLLPSMRSGCEAGTSRHYDGDRSRKPPSPARSGLPSAVARSMLACDEVQGAKTTSTPFSVIFGTRSIWRSPPVPLSTATPGSRTSTKRPGRAHSVIVKRTVPLNARR